MKKKTRIMTVLILLIISISICTGCKGKTPGNLDDVETKKSEVDDEIIYSQAQLKKSKELTISEDGILKIEVDSLARPDELDAEQKPVFLAVRLKEDTDIGMQYTYDTYGKEGLVFCCDVNDSDTDETRSEPIYAMRLAQSSGEDYGEIWQSGGNFLKKGTNLFYMSGGDQTLPYRMQLKLTFFEPEKIENAVLYPADDALPSSDNG